MKLRLKHKGGPPERQEKSKDDQRRQAVVQGFDKKSGLGKRLAEGLERGMLKVACPRGEALTEGSEQYKAYKFQYKRLCTHLRRNNILSEKLKSGELDAEELASMGDEALMAESQRNELQQFRQEQWITLGITAEDSVQC
eukprot:g20970.t2